jgi:hypothetical protein
MDDTEFSEHSHLRFNGQGGSIGTGRVCDRPSSKKIHPEFSIFRVDVRSFTLELNQLNAEIYTFLFPDSNPLI